MRSCYKMQNAQTLQDMIMVALTASGTTITEDVLISKAQELRETLTPMFPVSDDDFHYIVRKIQEQLPVRMDVGICLQDRRNNYAPWYKSRTAKINPVFWNRFRKYLSLDKKWNQDVVNTIDKVSDHIVGLLGDPESEKPFSRKGLVLGDVQSGKTVNFTAVCNKAVDAGYRIVILLAGTIETLRKQTQDRMDLEFAGINSYNQFHRIKEETLPGVSRHDKNGLVISFTTNKSDFNANALCSHNMSLHTVAPKVPIFFVVKKNVSILKNLLEWLQNRQNIGPNNKIDLPVLVLDDEADNASINVNDPDSDPTQTNARIRELLKIFSKVSYLAITATPFANIFIDPDTESEMYEDDLFPRDFIYALLPPTSDQPIRSYGGYIGTNEIFGNNPLTDMVISLDDIENILPKKHKTGYPFKQMPLSLKEAIAYFCIANAIRDLRGDMTAHRSMLIHISHLKSLHKQIEDQVSKYFLSLKYAIQNYAALPIEKSMQIEELIFIKKIWDKYNLADNAGCNWEDLLKSHLFSAVAPIVVQVVNSNGGILDYEGNKKNGLRVIAIGGNCLSRGLTLEGLMVSYFRRNTMMYDTLLQMGRWFGFRPSYADLCKIWMPDEVKEWFEQITESYIELKSDIYIMQEQGKSPKDFGMKVRMHPGSLLPTARNKMREAKPVTRPINIAGRLLETPRLKRCYVNHNRDAVCTFVSEMSNVAIRDTTQETVPFWHEVDSKLVADFLRNFKTDAWNLQFQGDKIAEYVDQHPEKWDVAIMSGGQGEGSRFTFPNGLCIKSEVRSVTEDNGVLKISGKSVRVGAGGAAKIGLTPNKIEEAKQNHAKAREKNHQIGEKITDNWYFSVERQPLLMIHVIEERDIKGSFIFAIGTGFPGNTGETKIAKYAINSVEQRQAYEENIGASEPDPQEVQ